MGNVYENTNTKWYAIREKWYTKIQIQSYAIREKKRQEIITWQSRSFTLCKHGRESSKSMIILVNYRCSFSLMAGRKKHLYIIEKWACKNQMIKSATHDHKTFVKDEWWWWQPWNDGWQHFQISWFCRFSLSSISIW